MFIGANCTIVSNVEIGPNVIVGAASLVNKDIADGVYAGNPTRYICSIEEFESKRENTLIWKDKRGISKETEIEMWAEFFKSSEKRMENK